MKKKVLVIDDSALMRRVISDIINADEQLQVEDTANNGFNALELLLKGKKYDVILVDINMPKMDGVQFLKEMNKNQIRIPTIVVSSIASESTKETIQALELGAFDFIKKPSGPVGDAFVEFRSEIFTTVYCACNLGNFISDRKKENAEVKLIAKVPPVQRERRTTAAVSLTGQKIVVIASSTGGPKALQSVIPYFPSSFPYPIVVIQHMPGGFTASLANRLDEMSQMKVKEIQDGDVLRKGHIYIAQGGKQCELLQKDTRRYVFSETDKPARGGLRPCADVFFESLVNTSFDEVVCGVLTGMGSDASKGIQQVKAYKNVKVIAQNEATCVVYGMPRAVQIAGIVDEMVPLEDVAGAMMKKIGV